MSSSSSFSEANSDSYLASFFLSFSTSTISLRGILAVSSFSCTLLYASSSPVTASSSLSFASIFFFTSSVLRSEMHLNSTPSGMTSSNFAERYFLQASSSSAPTGLVREACMYFFFCFLLVYISLKSVQYTVRSTSTSVFAVCSSARTAASFRTTGKLRMSHSLRVYSCSRTSNLWSREVDPVTAVSSNQDLSP